MSLWYRTDAPTYEAKRSKSIIHPFSVKGYGGLTINPYQGCQHRCAYCYATYEWSPDFYDKIYAKSNAPEVLEKELAAWKGDTIDPVMVASATDAYQPAELKYGLTRKCVQILQKYNAPYYVFTKSSIIERDIELHARYSRNCLVVWSITACSEKVRRVVEPGTPPARRIYQAIRKFADAGVPCAVNVDPILPLVTDTEGELDAIVRGCRDAGVSHVFGAMLRMRGDIWERMKAVLALLGVESAAERYRQLYGFKEPLNASYVSCDRQYANNILDCLKEKVRRAGMSTDFPDHMGPKKIDRSSLGQTTMLSYT
ncbi:MAG: radical SAM protein [Nitrososphaera sp.]|uniref:SPL family radical SAM protein n=1 Tax=Nitrososphaera sp. TaxID=1971748 RepID=UPI003D6E7BDF